MVNIGAAVLGDLAVLGKDLSDGNRLKYGNTLQGGDISWLLSIGLTKGQILQYLYPSDSEMDKANIRIVFMDYFMKEFSLFSNSNFSALRGLHIKKSNPLINPEYYGTSMLDEDFININMYIRYLKFGFGRTTDIVNEEIRYGRMTREEGIKLVSNYDGNFDQDILNHFCIFINITENQFWDTVDLYVNKNLFKKNTNGKGYTPKFKVGVDL